MKYIRKWWWLLPIVLFDIWLFAQWRGCVDGEGEGAGGCRRRPPPPAPPPPAIEALTVGFPTAQTNLHLTNDASVFMPTASGRVVSALHGSTRTRLYSGRAAAAFHEGIDIAPRARNAAGHALDDVFAIADGRMAYANRNAGASSYGRYVVIEHLDSLGPVYSLYSHLASVAEDLQPGEPIVRGQTLGRIGHSSTLGIPRSRSHLHFEMGLMLNRRFEAWCRQQKIGTQHGPHHGWNLTGIDPLALYATPETTRLFLMRDHLATLPPAFELGLRADRPLDYFDMYAGLWRAPTPPAKTMVLSVSHGGVITAGRPATPEEHALLRKQRELVLRVDTQVLGRNGRGLITQHNQEWTLTRAGKRWIDILTY